MPGRRTPQEEAQYNLEHPIWHTDFSKPLHEIIREVRHTMTELRGTLEDIGRAKPGWKPQTRDVVGSLTLSISYLYHLIEDMKKAEIGQIPGAIRWNPRGIGVDNCPGCFMCYVATPGLMANIAAFVKTKEDGEKIASYIPQSWLDWREQEPGWIQVKVGACKTHQSQLIVLNLRWYVAPTTMEEITNA